MFLGSIFVRILKQLTVPGLLTYDIILQSYKISVTILFNQLLSLI